MAKCRIAHTTPHDSPGTSGVTTRGCSRWGGTKQPNQNILKHISDHDSVMNEPEVGYHNKLLRYLLPTCLSIS